MPIAFLQVTGMRDTELQRLTRANALTWGSGSSRECGDTSRSGGHARLLAGVAAASGFPRAQRDGSTARIRAGSAPQPVGLMPRRSQTRRATQGRESPPRSPSKPPADVRPDQLQLVVDRDRRRARSASASVPSPCVPGGRRHDGDTGHSEHHLARTVWDVQEVDCGRDQQSYTEQDPGSSESNGVAGDRLSPEPHHGGDFMESPRPPLTALRVTRRTCCAAPAFR